MKSFLLFRLRYIGDVLLTTPAIRLLRRGFPDAHITMVVNRGTEEILRYNPHVNEVLALERGATWKLMQQLRRRCYDMSLDFFNGDRAAWMAWASRAAVRIGFEPERRWRRLLFHRVIALREEHMVEKCLRLVEEGLGLKATDTTLELHTSEDDERYVDSLSLPRPPFAVVHLGVRYPVNRWPLERWVGLIRELPMPVVFVGGQTDTADTEWVYSRSKTTDVLLVGKTSILQLAALLRRATVFLGHDSGPMHIAAAMGTRVVALFGPNSEPVWWHPWGEGHVVLSTRSSVGEVLASTMSRTT